MSKPIEIDLTNQGVRAPAAASVGTALPGPTDPSPQAVSAIRRVSTGADERLEIDGESVLRFHPLRKPVRDGTPRCFACGQIDEEPWHEEAYCPAMGGALPFPTSTLTLKLKADSGYRCEETLRITLEQWLAINEILNASADTHPKGGDAVAAPFMSGAVGAAETPNV